MKRKYLLLVVAALLIVAAAAGGTLASGYVESGNILGEVSEKSLGIAIVSENGRVGTGGSGICVVPGAVNKLDYRISNDKKGGYECYAKVNLYFGWSSDVLLQDQLNNGYVKLYLGGQELPAVDSYERQVKLGDWIVAYCDREQAVLYYTKPMGYGDSAVFLDEIAFSTELGNQYAGVQFWLDMDVTAVQADNSDEAIAAELGVYPTIENGSIARVSETR